jgi:hypothetical protein
VIVSAYTLERRLISSLLSFSSSESSKGVKLGVGCSSSCLVSSIASSFIMVTD